MYRLLTYFSCCLALGAGLSLIPDDYVEHALPTTSFPEVEGFPLVVDTWTELGQSTPEEETIMDQEKINWQPLDQEPDLRENHEIKARSVDDKIGSPSAESSSAGKVVMEETSSTVPVTTTTRVASEIVKEESISPVRESSTTVRAEVSQSLPKDGVTEATTLLTRDGNVQTCQSPQESGIPRLLRTALPVLPADKLQNILANAVQSDAQVKNLVQLLRSDAFRQQVQNLRATKEYKTLQDYVCQRLKLDYSNYLIYVRVFLNIYIDSKPTSDLPNRRPGVSGLLQDLRNALPRTQLRDLYVRLYAVDRELSESVRLIRGREFRNVLRDIRITKEYISIREELRKADVPLQRVANLVSTALGWSNNDMGEEIVVVYL
ncbi:uncharacterized protein Dwil_GK15414 [Drosophila willistoni]|uniref:Uncharacterized protein n=1 Tax=Drosophila willistoni TaxID=7260 RepID=B4MV11_DROWI|nr:uncharacterized protein LOC6642451 [Drosophila willistoni]EDW76356.1 uncharacterized protein Dwil_GK15414 [Drosophila willistoni]